MLRYFSSAFVQIGIGENGEKVEVYHFEAPTEETGLLIAVAYAEALNPTGAVQKFNLTEQKLFDLADEIAHIQGNVLSLDLIEDPARNPALAGRIWSRRSSMRGGGFSY